MSQHDETPLETRAVRIIAPTTSLTDQIKQRVAAYQVHLSAACEIRAELIDAVGASRLAMMLKVAPKGGSTAPKRTRSTKAQIAIDRLSEEPVRRAGMA
jgi:hypothetical protein